MPRTLSSHPIEQRSLPGWVLCLRAAPLLLLGGCAPLQVGLGLRVRLDQVAVTALEARLSQGPGMAPGDRSPMVVTVTAADGATLVTEGVGGGKVRWEDLRLSATGVTVTDQGLVSLSKDPRDSEGVVPRVTITADSHPGLRAELEIPVRYDHAFVCTFQGARGTCGMNGAAGGDGASAFGLGQAGFNGVGGTLGQAGFNGVGGNGGRGGNGWNGGNGEDAPALSVQATLKPGARPLLQVAVTAAGRRERFLVDPEGGSLEVRAKGGAGGSGGRGGAGGRGGSGAFGRPSGLPGPTGMAGQDGWPGRGGVITLTYDPAVRPHLGALRLISEGGSGSPGPAPVRVEAAVARLW